VRALKILTVLAGAKEGGAETFFISLNLALARAGLDIRAALKPNAAREARLGEGGIPYVTAPFSSPFDIVTSGRIRRLAASFGPRAVLAFAGRAAARTPKGDYALIGRLGGYYTMKNFAHCDHLVCNAPDLVRYVMEAGWARARVTLIPNFPSLPEAKPVVRGDLDTPQHVPLAVALGRLHPNKGLDVLLRALPRVPGLFLWIAGEGPERDFLERLARDLGVAPRVRFLGWRADRAALFRAADLCVYPSRAEPFGNVVVEAWACGTPIVTTASTGPKWLARDGEDAIVTPVDDADSLAEGILRVLGSKMLAERLAAAGRRRIADEFSEAAIVARYIRLFEQAAS
jgi:glycosyltransferase involved in cell wall biosynthesis